MAGNQRTTSRRRQRETQQKEKNKKGRLHTEEDKGGGIEGA